MTSLTALCTVAAVGVLAVILVYIAQRGVSSLTLHFLIDSPKPVGEGGGIGNAILGSALLLALSCVVGIPVGIATGIYLSEVGRGWFSSVVRFFVDTLTGIPSIVTGVFVYAIIVLRMKHFSAYAGGAALALIMIPIIARTTEEMIKLVPHSLREGALALGRPNGESRSASSCPRPRPELQQVSCSPSPAFQARRRRFYSQHLAAVFSRVASMNLSRH
jgi:phosphate transport system permease protein